jgi:prevent-host-death family protein
MALIGVRELREQATEVIRRVREEKAEYVITYQGRPVAMLVPIDEEAVEEAIVRASKQSITDPWDRFFNLMESIRNEWPAGVSTQELLDEIRGDD